MTNQPDTPREILRKYALALMENARNAASNEDEDEISEDLLEMMGVAGVTYSYQWILNDGKSDDDIKDAVGATCLVEAENLDKTTEVNATFANDAGNEESLTSVLTNPLVMGGLSRRCGD